MRILIATDAWHPQINGVVRTLTELAQAAERFGVCVHFLTPEGIPSIGLPSYPDIRLALASPSLIARRIEAIRPDAIHIATEGSIGLLTRRYCRRHGRPFTTSFHTRFADYIAARWPVPRDWAWAFLRRFHNAGNGVMAATPSLADELSGRGFCNVMLWPRGVDTGLFYPRPSGLGLPGPVFLTVGRLSVEKNLDAFLALDLPGSKVVVGDGPTREDLARRFPDVTFLGARQGEDLAAIYAAADVFVFPSRTDTFGLVLLEALASGVPIAGVPAAATRDVIGDAPVGILDEDLRAACLQALTLSREACLAHARTMSWEHSARGFVANILRAIRGCGRRYRWSRHGSRAVLRTLLGRAPCCAVRKGGRYSRTPWVANALSAGT
ncbi:MAG: glycosyl transferase, group 1 [Xanthobacteraceae bacterium]|nr:glycosyl transferase, group 1 [Xanthobacteraceae bacterium]